MPLPKKNQPRFRLAKSIVRLLTRSVNFALTLLLILQFAIAWFLHNDTTLTLPEFAKNRVLKTLADAGVIASFKEIRVSMRGQLEISQLEIFAPNAKKPVLTARHATADFNVLDALRKKISPHHLFLDGATFYANDTFDSAENYAPVLSDLRAEISHEGDWIHLKTLQTRLGMTPLIAHGDLRASLFSEKKTPAEDSAPFIMDREKWHRLADIARQISTAKNTLEQHGKFSLEIACANEGNNATEFTIRALAHEITLPWNATAAGAQILASVIFDGRDFSPKDTVEFSAKNMGWHDENTGYFAQVENLRLRCKPDKHWEIPSAADFFATNISAMTEEIRDISGTTNWQNFPEIFFDATIVKSDDFLKINGTADLEKRAGNFQIFARFIPENYLEHPQIKTQLPEILDTLKVPELTEISGAIRFEPDLTFAEANLKIATGTARFMQFLMKNGTADVRLTPEKISITNADLHGENDHVDAEFFTGFTRDSDFRFLIFGSAQPSFLNPLLPDWWAEIWQHVEVHPERPGLTDIDIHGNWLANPTIYVFCAAAANDLKFHETPISHAEIRIVSTDDTIALHDIFATEKNSTARGTLYWKLAAPDFKRQDSLRFHFEGIVMKEIACDIVEIFLPNFKEILAPIDIEMPAQIAVTGVIHDEASPTPDRVQVSVEVAAPGVIHAWKVPFIDFQGVVAYDDSDLVITLDNAQFSGGIIAPNAVSTESARTSPSRVWIDLHGESPVAFFDISIANARRSDLLASINLLKNDTDDAQNPQKNVPSKTPAKPDKSSLDLHLTGAITPPDLGTLRANGHLLLRDPNLGELHVFGGLSRVLNKIGVTLTSFSLDRAETDLFIRNKILYVPDATLSGSDSFVKTAGNYNLENDTLNFQAILTVTSGTKIPIIGNIFEIVNRLPHLTPVNVHGTLENPQWETMLFGGKLDTSLGTPPDEKKPPAQKK